MSTSDVHFSGMSPLRFTAPALPAPAPHRHFSSTARKLHAVHGLLHLSLQFTYHLSSLALAPIVHHTGRPLKTLAQSVLRVSCVRLPINLGCPHCLAHYPYLRCKSPPLPVCVKRYQQE